MLPNKYRFYFAWLINHIDIILFPVLSVLKTCLSVYMKVYIHYELLALHSYCKTVLNNIFVVVEGHGNMYLFSQIFLRNYNFYEM